MKVLTDREAAEWCKARAILVTDRRFLYYDSPGWDSIALEPPDKPYVVPHLANLLLPWNVESPFQGALLWIREWGIWDERTERVGFRVLEQLRKAHGEIRTVKEAPAQYFDETELLDAQMCFTQPMVVGWDAFMVPSHGEYFVFVSHDGPLYVIARAQVTHQEWLQTLKDCELTADERYTFS